MPCRYLLLALLLFVVVGSCALLGALPVFAGSDNAQHARPDVCDVATASDLEGLTGTFDSRDRYPSQAPNSNFELSLFPEEGPSMFLRRGLRAVALGSIGLMLSLSPAQAETLKVGGTGAVTALLGQIGTAFTADTGIVLNVVPRLGTSGAIGAVADGKLGLAISGRLLRDKETGKGLRVVATWRTPFGFVTSRSGPDNFDRARIADLYRADRPLWPDDAPILLHLRPTDESDNSVLGESFAGMAEALQFLRKRPDLSIAATDQDNADLAERVKGSLTAATLTQIVAEKRKLTFVSIDGVDVSLENFEKGTYPYGKSLYVIAPSGLSPEAEAFLAFLAKPAGVAMLRQGGMIAAK